MKRGMMLALLIGVMPFMALDAQVITNFKVGETIYYKNFGRCYKAKVTGILDNVPGYGKRIKILTDGEGSKKSNAMVDGSMKNTSLNVDPKDLSRISDCGIISRKGYKIGDALFYNDYGNCKPCEVVAISDNTNQINVYFSQSNSMSNVLEDKLSRLADCGIQSKAGFKVGDVIFYKDFTGKCKKVEIKNILNDSMISVYLLDGSNTRLNVNPKDLYKISPCK